MAQQTLRYCDQCGCRLSQYNPDGLCASCARSRIEAAPALPVVPERVWQDAGVQQAFAALDFGKASRLIRQRGSLRQEDMARLTGLSQAFLSMLESGRRRLTNIDKIIEFLAGVGAPAELLRLPLPRPVGRSPQRPADRSAADLDPSLPWTSARMVAALDHTVGYLAEQLQSTRRNEHVQDVLGELVQAGQNPYALDGLLDAEIGGFASDAHRRPALVALAQRPSTARPSIARTP
ncbi:MULTISPECIES: helix-turn-helix domain-containing protein [unclassified Streptomyces]|uniref:helix-turn-helix domain-containing protein n=1 Tax=unclassified Streptomyces TaxID=2593676 RepID=UPI0006B03830|nr:MULTISPECIES: helix-turn-helix domain-containing protein [unclassified Streptomyces]MCX5155794.1 helix-turn-helix domain-containing protein [Streptomyces sp. NBC_00291]